MRTFLTLDLGGTLSALLLGIGLLVTGWLSGVGPSFLLIMLYFLLVSALVTRRGKEAKKRMGLFERSRGWKNVAANGLVPFIISVLYLNAVMAAHYFMPPPSTMLFLYVASVAAITSDKFASEIGVLSGDPIMLLTLKRAKKGTSGAVSWAGLLASVIGSFLIAISMPLLLAMAGYNLPGISVLGIAAIVLLVTLCGFIGNLADSLAGYFEENGMGNKYTSNILCSVIGALAAFLLLLL